MRLFVFLEEGFFRVLVVDLVVFVFVVFRVVVVGLDCGLFLDVGG